MHFVEHMGAGLPVQWVGEERAGDVHLAWPAGRLKEHRAATASAERPLGTWTRFIPGWLPSAWFNGEALAREPGPRHERCAVRATAIAAVAMRNPFGWKARTEPDCATKTGARCNSGVHCDA